MAGQIAQYGAMFAANLLSGAVVPVVQGSAPTWSPGMIWVNTSSGNSLNQWNGAAWVTTPAPGNRYLALLTADPVAGGAVNMADLVELSIGGYSRQLCAFATSPTIYPAACENSGVITFGPISSSMVIPVQWCAMVTSTSGTTGFFLWSWALNTPVQVNASQEIQVGIDQFIIQAQ